MFRKFLFAASLFGLSLIAIADSRSDDAAKKSKMRAPAQAPSVIVSPGADSIGLARELPKVWIGVRVTPVPEALSSHIGRVGLMVANIVTGGPADQAGVQRYDVLVSLNGTAITEMDQLIRAVSDAGVGKSATLVVIRGGKETTLTVTPVDRSPDGPTAFKYEEAAPEVDQDVQYFGHRIARDPTGNWMFSPLGRMNLPDDVKDNLGDPSSPAWQGLKDWRDFLRVGPFGGFMSSDPGGQMFLFPDGEDGDASADRQVQIQISVNENGNQLSINRNADGKITVRRTDSQGAVDEKTFDSMERFRTEDPEGYKTYRQFSGYRTRTMITLPPEMKDLDAWQQDFQTRLREALEESRRMSRQALEDSRRLQESLKRSPK